MALKDELIAKLNEIDDMERSLEAERETYNQLTKDLYEQQAQVEKKRLDADEAIKKAGGIEEVKRLHDEYLSKINALDKEIIAQKRKNRELITWENKLVDIEKRQDAEHVQLVTAKQELELDKASYKDELKTKFLEALKQQLPQ
jgi:galactose mutarotase-like enzyme